MFFFLFMAMMILSVSVKRFNVSGAPVLRISFTEIMTSQRVLEEVCLFVTLTVTTIKTKLETSSQRQTKSLGLLTDPV